VSTNQDDRLDLLTLENFALKMPDSLGVDHFLLWRRSTGWSGLFCGSPG